MFKSVLNVNNLRQWHKWFAYQQPVHVHRWIVVGGNGFDTPYSYAFSTSYLGGIADGTQEVFKDSGLTGNSAGSVASKNFVIVIPHDPGMTPPNKGDMLILYRTNGDVYARVWTVFVQPYDTGIVGSTADTVYKYDVHVQLIQS